MPERESDDRIVPMKPGNSGGGKAVKPSRDSSRTPAILSGGPAVRSRLDRITKRAEQYPEAKFTNLFTLIDLDLLRISFHRLERDKAPGVDGQRVIDYEANLESNLEDLLARLHRGGYRPQPSLRREIPKGNGKTRPLALLPENTGRVWKIRSSSGRSLRFWNESTKSTLATARMVSVRVDLATWR